ncbi:rab11-binding protein relch [Anaeramoeba flamelloides]|uniref:Rab11-binding protein relch n=1 Tax=Anaeramoeba flamelloides TaxID=1746091 RepID=A0AAV7ZGK5_9EUKA|nr:rab11-binding protein relch [Anaeramoeba flamelloides]
MSISNRKKKENETTKQKKKKDTNSLSNELKKTKTELEQTKVLLQNVTNDYQQLQNEIENQNKTCLEELKSLDVNSNKQTQNEQISIFETENLNYLIKEYLIERDYTATTITMLDDVDEQDLEEPTEWILEKNSNITLLKIFRAYQSNSKITDQIKNAIQQNSRNQKTIANLKKRIEEQEKEKKSLLGSLELKTKEINKLEEKCNQFEKHINEGQKKIQRLESFNENLKQEKQEKQEEEEKKQKEKKTKKDQDKAEKKKDQEKQEEREEKKEKKVKKVKNKKEEKKENKVQTENEEKIIKTQDNLKDEKKQDQQDTKLYLSKYPIVLPSKLKKDRHLKSKNENNLRGRMARVAIYDDSEQSLIKIVSESLPHIIQNVLLKTRKELLPIFLTVIRQNPDPKQRDHLTHLLFNLIARPDERQRQIIIDGFSALASTIGYKRVETELLPQLWSQINHKYEERRLLVAQSCGELAEFVNPELRGSLMLSILRSLGNDPNPQVRRESSKQLGLLLFYYNNNKKFETTFELLFSFLFDKDEDVQATTYRLTFPRFGKWCFSQGQGCEILYQRMIKVLKFLLNLNIERESISKKKTQDLKNNKNNIQLQNKELESILIKDETPPKILRTILACQVLIPSVFSSILVFSPFGNKYRKEQENQKKKKRWEGAKGTEMKTKTKDKQNGKKGSRKEEDKKKNQKEKQKTKKNETEGGKAKEKDSINQKFHYIKQRIIRILGNEQIYFDLNQIFNNHLKEKYENENENENIYENWKEFEIFIKSIIPELLEFIIKTKIENESIHQGLTELISIICKVFGKQFTKNIMKRQIEFIFNSNSLTNLKDLTNIKVDEISIEEVKNRLFGSYILGVLLSSTEKEMTKNLTRMILNISLEKNGLNSNNFNSICSCLIKLIQIPNKANTKVLILDICWELIYHSSAQVRKNIVRIFNSLIPYLEIEQIMNRVVTGLNVLASGPDGHITLLTIEAFGTVLKFVKNEDYLENTIEKLETYFKDDSATSTTLGKNNGNKNNLKNEKREDVDKKNENELKLTEKNSQDSDWSDEETTKHKEEKTPKKIMNKNEKKKLKKKKNQERHEITSKFLVEFEKIIPLINPKLRETYVLPKLLQIAQDNQFATKKRRIVISFRLLSVYRAFSGTPISQNSITKHYIPGLNCLLSDVGENIIDGKYHQTITSMIIEAEALLPKKRSVRSAAKKLPNTKIMSKFRSFKKRNGKD